MRLISLRQYSLITIQSIRQSDELKFSKILKEIDSNEMLYGPALCYYFSVKKKPFKSSNSRIYDELTKIQELGIETQKAFFEYVREGDNQMLIDFIDSFLSYNKERDQNEIKNKCRYFVNKAHDEQGVSYYKMCKAAKINSGNFYLFYARNQNNRLSWAKCLKLLDFLNRGEF